MKIHAVKALKIRSKSESEKERLKHFYYKQTDSLGLEARCLKEQQVLKRLASVALDLLPTTKSFEKKGQENVKKKDRLQTKHFNTWKHNGLKMHLAVLYAQQSREDEHLSLDKMMMQDDWFK